MNEADTKKIKFPFAFFKKLRARRLELTDEHLETWQCFMERVLESETPAREKAADTIVLTKR